MLQSYPGILILDNNANHAWVRLPAVTALLMLDPNQTGGFSWDAVTAAWQHYASVAGGQSGMPINPQGFAPLTGNFLVVHVVIP